MTPSPSRAARTLLAEIIARGRPPNEHVAAVEDWPALIACAAGFKILPTVAATLVGSALPAALAERLADLRAETAANNALRRADLDVACIALSRAALPFVVLKGGAMLLCGLVAPSARHLHDIDLRISPDAADDVRRCLAAAGFQFAPRVGFDGLPERPRDVNGWGPHGTLLELHCGSDGAPRRTFAAELAESIEVRTRDVTVRVPALDALLAGLSRHVLFHHAADPLFVPRHVADVRALLGAGARPRGAASTASVWLLDAIARAPALGAQVLFPAGVQLQVRAALSSRAIFWASVAGTLAHPATIRHRVFPHASYFAQEGLDGSLRGRLLRLARPLRWT